jgi:hypothetical protein
MQDRDSVNLISSRSHVADAPSSSSSTAAATPRKALLRATILPRAKVSGGIA